MAVLQVLGALACALAAGWVASELWIRLTDYARYRR
jgi:hypothetical protein